MDKYKETFLAFLEKESQINEPNNLYTPIRYIMQMGGKRLRPILVLLSCDLFSETYEEALNAALGVEMFHNFTLLHDDIMDSADIRRGMQTVHKRWDINTGILSGDALMIMSYKMLEKYPVAMYKDLMLLFNKTALQVCEGQQYDIDFESIIEVGADSYFKMIGFKTGVLVASSLKMGAIIGSASKNDQQHMYEFGLNLGIAFQLQDDYLDTYGTENFGKKIGGDIIENKKTILYIKAMEFVDEENKKKLIHLYSNNLDENDKVTHVKQIFTKFNVDVAVLKEIEDFTNLAFKHVEKLSIHEKQKQVLIDFGMRLMKRKI